MSSRVRAVRALPALGLIVALVAGCRSSAGSGAGCKPGEPFCWCPAGASCSQTCTGPSCALFCANGNAACTLHGGDGCSASCQNAQTCSATCGKASTVACQYVKGTCTATVGEASRVHCEGAALCDITCTGACNVDCPGGHCRVHCADPATCSLSCDKAGPAGAACADPAIKVCSASCG